MKAWREGVSNPFCSAIDYAVFGRDKETPDQYVQRRARERARAVADEVFKALLGKPLTVRAIYEELYGPSPWLGWAPMLCKLVREVEGR